MIYLTVMAYVIIIRKMTVESLSLLPSMSLLERYFS